MGVHKHKTAESFFSKSYNPGGDVIVLIRKGIVPFPMSVIDNETANAILTVIFGENRDKSKLIGWLNGVQTLDPVSLLEIKRHYNVVGVVMSYKNDNGFYLFEGTELEELFALFENNKGNNSSWEIANALFEKITNGHQ